MLIQEELETIRENVRRIKLIKDADLSLNQPQSCVIMRLISVWRSKTVYFWQYLSKLAGAAIQQPKRKV